jgi:hypothetical protein
MPLAQSLRVHVMAPVVRFEGLPGEFSQHDFGEVRVRYHDGAEAIGRNGKRAMSAAMTML